MNYRVLVTVLAVSVLSACASIGPNYPAQWGKKASSEFGKYCDISGIYNAKGEAHSENPQPEWLIEPYRLNDVIFPTFWFPKVSHIAVHKNDAKSVIIVLWNGEKKVFEKELREENDEIQCADDHIKLSYSREPSPSDSEFGAVVSKKIVSYLYKTKTGDLVVNVKDVQAGFAILLVPIPMGYEGSYWYLFQGLE